MEDDPLCLLSGFSRETVRRLRENAKVHNVDTPTVWSLRSVSKNETAALLKRLLKGVRPTDIDRMVKSVHSLPFVSIIESDVRCDVEKATGRAVGTLRINMSMNGGEVSFTSATQSSLSLVLGTPQRKTLLANRSIRVHGHVTKKQVELEFDWSAANAGGGEGEGFMILRLLFEEFRGLDGEIHIPLRQKGISSN